LLLAPLAVLAQDLGSITGKVVDAVGAAISAKLSLTRSGAPVLSATANADGTFSLEGVAPGDYTLAAAEPGFLDLQLPVTVQPGMTTSLSSITLQIPPAPDCLPLRFELPQVKFEPLTLVPLARTGTEIRGRTADINFEALPGVSIVVMSSDGKRYTATSDAKGNFVLRGVPPGTYPLRASLPGHADFLIRSLVVKSGQETRIDSELQIDKCRPGKPCPPTEEVSVPNLCL
jgi:hypothetical protein